MSEDQKKSKGGGFKSLFFKSDDTTEVPQQDAIPKTGSQIAADNLKIPSANVILPDKSLVETFVQKLEDLIDKNNQPGFDFLEFSQSLFEESQNPDPDTFKRIFRIAQKMDKLLTPARLLESAKIYKDLVQEAANTEMSKGASKKTGLQTEKETEKKNLEQAKIKASNQAQTLKNNILEIEKQILEYDNQALSANNQLLAIDQKYENQFTEIDIKIGAINTAKEKVISSIVDIEAGITSNLK